MSIFLPFSRAIQLLSVGLFLSLVIACAQKNTQSLDLVVLHTNDTHAAWGGFTKNGRICYASQCANGYGGSLRLHRAVQSLRAAHESTLFLDAGDQFQGTLFFALYKGHMTAEILNLLRYDAVAPGNHEFDDGYEDFSNYIGQLNMPVLAANFSYANTLVVPWVIVERQGQRIGLIGLIPPDSATITGLPESNRFSATAPALHKAVAELQAHNVHIIIALTHVGLNADRELAKTVAGVDLIVGGHSHSLLSNTEANAEGAYPIVEISPAGEPVLVVTAGYAGKYLGSLHVTFDANGVATAWKGKPIWLDDATLAALDTADASSQKHISTPDKTEQALAHLLDTRAQAVQAMLAQPIGRITAHMPDGEPLETGSVLQCRTAECLSGNIATDAIRACWQGQGYIDAALLNGGSLRTSLPSGTITSGNILETLPYDNPVVVAEMDGKILLAALEHGLSTIQDGKGRFLQVSGLRYTFNPQAPVGKRLLSAQIADKNGHWQPVQPHVMYRVATIKFLADGGDGYTLFSGLMWHNAKQSDTTALQNYITAHTPLSVQYANRITRVVQ